MRASPKSKLLSSVTRGEPILGYSDVDCSARPERSGAMPDEDYGGKTDASKSIIGLLEVRSSAAPPIIVARSGHLSVVDPGRSHVDQ